MSKQKSIQWFIEQLKNVGLDNILEKLPDTIGHAQLMHQIEIENAYDDGNNDGYFMAKDLHENVKYMTPEDYYQETYGGQDA